VHLGKLLLPLFLRIAIRDVKQNELLRLHSRGHTAHVRGYHVVAAAGQVDIRVAKVVFTDAT